MLDMKKHGDILEIAYYDKIVTALPKYEELWKLVTGNNGKAEIVKSGDEIVDEKRKNLSQHSYTVYESLVSIFRIAHKSRKIENLEDYLDANNDFILFHAHCGRIRDCVQKIGEKLSVSNLEARLEDFYQRRNEVLHGKKLPFTILEDTFLLPTISGVDFIPSSWHDKLNWEEISFEQLNIINEVYLDLYGTMINALNSIYSKLISLVKQSKEFEKTIKSLDDFQPDDSQYITLSGIQSNHQMPERIVGAASGSVIR